MLQIFGKRITFNLRAGKHNGLVDGGVTQPVVEQFALVLLAVGPEQNLFDIAFLLFGRFDLQTLRRAHDAGGQLLDARRDGGAEHHGLAARFGQFVDIDTFMKKDESYKVANLNELAAYLYCEDGIVYGDSDIRKRIEDFKTLPVKYIEGSIFFLLNLGKGLQELTTLYSKSPVMWWMMRTRIAWGNFGDGIKQLVSSRKTKFGKLMVLLTFPLFLVSTILLFLWILITNKREK